MILCRLTSISATPVPATPRGKTGEPTGGGEGEGPELFKDKDELRSLWSQPDTHKALLESLSVKGMAMSSFPRSGA